MSANPILLSRGDTSIRLVEKEELILNERKLTSMFSAYFGNKVQTLSNDAVYETR